MDRVPETVFLTLGIPRYQASELGMLGCGLQLDDSGEYLWREATITLDLSCKEVLIFLKVNGIPFTLIPNIRNTARISFMQMETFISKVTGIREFLRAHQRNKFLRLGSKAYLEPWELNSQEAFRIGMSDEDFATYYIPDPRGRLLNTEVTLRCSLHSPLLKGTNPPGLPDPAKGDWI